MTPPSPPLTGQARALLEAALHPGDLAIDATCGMGRDTVILARAVGPLGKVLAIDLQEIAVKATAGALAVENLAGRGDVISALHEVLRQRHVIAAGFVFTKPDVERIDARRARPQSGEQARSRGVTQR